ncbi:MAG: hypothetical protein JXA97_11015 [Anaerolineales bacterium]|nr:hypothetical protein [Anaerolineales bacterium]
MRSFSPDIAAWEWVLLAGMVCVLGLLAVVAWRSPAGTTDSLQYHMSRIMHWVQQGSLRHYATFFTPQLSNPFFPELVILHLRMLWGGDQPAGLVQWFAFVGSLLLVHQVAKMLGVGKKGRWFAVVFFFSLPQAVLQATSTQTDLVTAFWLLAFSSWVILAQHRELSAWENLAAATTAGIGLLTKATFYLYVFPWLVYHYLPRGSNFKMLLRNSKRGILALLIVLALNAGYWIRNLVTFGGLFGPSDRIATHTDIRLWPWEWLGAIIRQVGLNLATPSEGLNTQLTRVINGVARALGERNSNLTLVWSWNHEDWAGNPIHMIVAIVALFVLIYVFSRIDFRPKHYGMLVLSSGLVFSVFITLDAFGARYQIAAFALWAPMAGLLFEWLAPQRWFPLSIGFFILMALPYVLLNQTRPVVGWRPRTAIQSVFQEPGQDILFANWLLLRDDYHAASQVVRESACLDVGYWIDSHEPEYAWWWLLDAPQSGIRFQAIETYPELEQYLDRSYEPCAVICTMCGGRQELLGLERMNTFGSVSVFLDRFENE